MSAPSFELFQGIPREHRAEPIVKWAGGKKRLLAAYDALFPSHFETYHEPFIGGAAVFLYLKHIGRIRKAILSDINSELICLYRAVRDEPERLIERLGTFVYDKDVYYAVREQDPRALDPIGRAARMMYLNRTCFNGLYRVNQSGKFNVPFGRYDDPVICNAPNLRNMSRMLQGVEIQRWGFETVLELARPGDFVFFDPPYAPLSATSNFTTYSEDSFGEDAQVRLRDLFIALDRRGCLVMQSNSSAPLIRDLYRGYDVREVAAMRAINSNAGGRGKITELVIRNFA